MYIFIDYKLLWFWLKTKWSGLCILRGGKGCFTGQDEQDDYHVWNGSSMGTMIYVVRCVSVFGGGAKREYCHHSPHSTLAGTGWPVKPVQSIRYSASPKRAFTEDHWFNVCDSNSHHQLFYAFWWQLFTFLHFSLPELNFGHDLALQGYFSLVLVCKSERLLVGWLQLCNLTIKIKKNVSHYV